MCQRRLLGRRALQRALGELAGEARRVLRRRAFGGIRQTRMRCDTNGGGGFFCSKVNFIIIGFRALCYPVSFPFDPEVHFLLLLDLIKKIVDRIFLLLL